MKQNEVKRDQSGNLNVFCNSIEYNLPRGKGGRPIIKTWKGPEEATDEDRGAIQKAYNLGEGF